MLETERLILRPWAETDRDSLFQYAADPAVGPMAGWPPHKDPQESLEVIRRILKGKECYAITEKAVGKAIGSVELKLKGFTDRTDREDECELGFWLGRPFWGKGYMTEAARELLRRGFEELGMEAVWCGYYEGNDRSGRVQKKLGFSYHCTCPDTPVPLLKERRLCHVSVLTRADWEKNRWGL